MRIRGSLVSMLAEAIQDEAARLPMLDEVIQDVTASLPMLAAAI